MSILCGKVESSTAIKKMHMKQIAMRTANRYFKELLKNLIAAKEVSTVHFGLIKSKFLHVRLFRSILLFF